MTTAHSGNAPASHELYWPTTIGSLAVGAMFFSLWFWLLPRWLGFRVEMAGAAHWRWLAALPSLLGFAAMCEIPCTWGSRRAGLGSGLFSDRPI